MSLPGASSKRSNDVPMPQSSWWASGTTFGCHFRPWNQSSGQMSSCRVSRVAMVVGWGWLDGWTEKSHNENIIRIIHEKKKGVCQCDCDVSGVRGERESVEIPIVLYSIESPPTRGTFVSKLQTCTCFSPSPRPWSLAYQPWRKKSKLILWWAISNQHNVAISS